MTTPNEKNELLTFPFWQFGYSSSFDFQIVNFSLQNFMSSLASQSPDMFIFKICRFATKLVCFLTLFLFDEKNSRQFLRFEFDEVRQPPALMLMSTEMAMTTDSFCRGFRILIVDFSDWFLIYLNKYFANFHGQPQPFVVFNIIEIR